MICPECHGSGWRDNFTWTLYRESLRDWRRRYPLADAARELNADRAIWGAYGYTLDNRPPPCEPCECQHHDRASR